MCRKWSLRKKIVGLVANPANIFKYRQLGEVFSPRFRGVVAFDCAFAEIRDCSHTHRYGLTNWPTLLILARMLVTGGLIAVR